MRLARSRSISRSFVRCAAQSCVAVYRRAIGASIASIDRSIASAKYLAHRSRARVDPVVRRITIRDDTPATSMRARQKRDLEVRGADADDRCRHVARGDDWWMDVRGTGRGSSWAHPCGAWVWGTIGVYGGGDGARDGRCMGTRWRSRRARARRGGDRWGAMYAT